MATEQCPPFGTGSVDFNAVNEAARKGEDLHEAIEAATTRVEPLTEEEFAELPTLTGKTKAQLLEIAEAEGAEADETMTNAAIADRITMIRAAAPVVNADGQLLNPPPGDITDEPGTIGDADSGPDSAE